MTRSITTFFLGAVVLYSVAVSGCWSARESNAMPLVGSDSNVRSESTPTDLKFPKASGFVNDITGTLTAGEAEKIESGLHELHRRGKIDFAIAIVRTTNGKDIYDYSLGMAKEWKIGSENGGVLLVVAIDDRKWRIQIDKKLEKEFTDAEIKAIGDTMAPHFREQKYSDGIKACVKALVDELARRHDFERIIL